MRIEVFARSVVLPRSAGASGKVLFLGWGVGVGISIANARTPTYAGADAEGRAAAEWRLWIPSPNTASAPRRHEPKRGEEKPPPPIKPGNPPCSPFSAKAVGKRTYAMCAQRNGKEYFLSSSFFFFSPPPPPLSLPPMQNTFERIES